MKKLTSVTTIIFCFLSELILAQIDPTLIPARSLQVSTSWKRAQSFNNYLSDASSENLEFDGTRSHLVEDRFMLGLGLSFSENFFATSNLYYAHRVLKAFEVEEELASGRGLQKIDLSLGYSFKPEHFSISPELSFQIPLDTSHTFSEQDLAISDDVYEILLRTRIYYYLESLTFGLNPEFLATFPDGTTAVGSRAFVRWNVSMFSFEPFGHLRFSLSENLGEDANNSQHTTLGSGGAYAIRSISPSFIDIGILVNCALSNFSKIGFEYSKRVWGTRTSDSSFLGLNLTFDLEILPKDGREKLIEKPLNNDFSETP